MKTIEDLRQRRVELTPTVYYSNYLTMDDKCDNVISVFVYDDCYTIEKIRIPEQDSGRLFMVTIGNGSFHFDSLRVAEQHLWDNFLVDELRLNIPSLDEVTKFTIDEVEKKVDLIFEAVHNEFDVRSGDITPEQELELDELKARLSVLIAKQSHQNL